jgi:hypothetical protein
MRKTSSMALGTKGFPPPGVLLVSPGDEPSNAAIAREIGVNSIVITQGEQGMHKPQSGSFERIERFLYKHGPEYLR